MAQLKPFVLVDLAVEQSLGGTVELYEIIQLRLCHLCRLPGFIVTDIGKQAIVFFDGLYRQGISVGIDDGIAGYKLHACQRCCLAGVGPGVAGGHEQHGYRAVCYR